MNFEEIRWAENELRRIRRIAHRKRLSGHADLFLEAGCRALEGRLARLKAEEKQTKKLRAAGLLGKCERCGEPMPLNGDKCWNCVEKFSQQELFSMEQN